MRSEGSKTNRHWRCSRRHHGFDRKHRHNAAHQPPPGPPKPSPAIAMLRMSRGLPSRHEPSLSLIMQAPATARGNAIGPKSEDSGPFRAVVPQTAALDTLFPSLGTSSDMSTAFNVAKALILIKATPGCPQRPILDRHLGRQRLSASARMCRHCVRQAKEFYRPRFPSARSGPCSRHKLTSGRASRISG